MSSVLLLLLVCAPPGAAVVAACSRQHGRRALDLATAGAVVTLLAAGAGLTALVLGLGPLQLGAADQPWFHLDGVGALLAVVASLVTATVVGYARRHLDGDERAGRFATAALVLLTGTIGLATSTTLQLAAVAWLVASAATVALCGYRGDRAGRRVARRALAALLVGDAAIVASAALATVTAGALHFDGAAGELADRSLGGPVSVSVGAVVVALVAVGALARAGQVPLRPWMTGTVDVPTPVSALLHAGSVNAGGFLLVRSSDLLWEAPAVRLLLGVAAAATMVMAASGLRARPDTKGRLATSTAGQMGVMLLAAAVGAPAVVLTHLAGHSLYKSTRFLGAGDAIRRSVAARRAATGGAEQPTSIRVGRSCLITGTAVVTWLWLGSAAGLTPIELGTTAALIASLVATGSWEAAAAQGIRAATAGLSALTGAAVIGIGAALAHASLSIAHPDLAGGAPAAFALVAVALLAVAVAGLGLVRPLTELALRWATAPPGEPRPVRPARPIPAMGTTELGRSW